LEDKEMKKLCLIFAALMVVSTVFAAGGGQQGGQQSSGGSVAITPIPYPVNPSAQDSSKKVKYYDLNEVMEYKALPNYSEPDSVAALVRQGKLPAAKDRLPEKPYVIKTSFMADGGGKYGGVFANVFAVPIEGWNYPGGAVCGWFGIEAVYDEELLDAGPAYLRKDRTEPFPNLATDWTWGDDGYTLTMNLVKGARWSDGAPFTADDIMFHWEDNINDPNVSTWSSPGTWAINGKPTKLEKINDYQIKWTFGEPYPVSLLWAMADNRLVASPAHFFKPLHPKYNPNATYQSYRTTPGPTQLPAPGLGPWVPAQYKVDELLVMKRNPYFWKVDSDGKQLPYIDEVHFVYSTNDLARTMNTMAGTCDLSNVGEGYDEVARGAASANAAFRVDWQGDAHGYGLEFNLDSKYGVQSDQDTANRDLFRDVRFRRAVTMAIDRDGIAASMSSGPFFRAWGGGLLPASPLFSRESVYYLPYNVNAAKALLADMGLKPGRDGFLTYASGPMAGKTIEIQILTGSSSATGVPIVQACIPMLQTVGIKASLKTVQGAAGDELLRNGQWDMRIQRYDAAWLVPNAFPNNISPNADNILNLHYKIKTYNDAMPFENELVRITNEFAAATDPAKQKQLMADWNRVWTENATTVGIVTASYGMLLNKYMKNVQPGLPVNIYSWGHNSMFMEQLWYEPEHQRPLVMGNNVPTPADYPKF
jgi:peptide/nickel transport system substrate-binding protein